MGCITSIFFSFTINNAASPFFHAQRGLHQGYPLSPLLFILFVESLSLFIKDVVRHRNFHGIEISQVLAITHLLFVDDILFFFNGSGGDIDKLMELLLFGTAVGMVVNVWKSTVVVHNLGEAKIDHIRGVF